MLHRPNDVNYPQALNLPGAGALPIPTEDSQLSESSRVALLRELLGEANCRNMGIYEIPQGFRLSVVIPVYNEVETIATVIQRVRNSDVPSEIIVVDDGSSDGTRDLLASWESEPDLCVVFHDRNLGKGAAPGTTARCPTPVAPWRSGAGCGPIK